MKMKGNNMDKKRGIGIVTVYNSYNYGSILQAKALYTALNEYGDVYFVNTGARSITRQGIKEILRGIKTFNINRIRFESRRFAFFRNLRLEIPIISLEEAKATCGVFVFGSDEIWNVGRKQFSDFPIFWGDGLEGKKISYGPSINNTTEQELKKGQWKRLLASFDAISVRDLYSKNAIGKITDTPIEVVVDPTMLLECDFEPISAHKGRHIALYISDKKFSDKEKAIKLIKQFANNKKEVIVSLGLWTKWADENFVDSHIPPFNYYAGADYVITNTFHGTVFAILQQKQFVAFVGRNRKIVELLDMLNLNERIVNEEMNIEQFNNILDGQIDYMTVNNSLNRIRTQSRDYLRDSL